MKNTLLRFIVTSFLVVLSVAFFSVMAKELRTNSGLPGEYDPKAKLGEDKHRDTTLVNDSLNCKDGESIFKKMKCVPKNEPKPQCKNVAPTLECHEQAPAMQCKAGEKAVLDLKCL